MSHLPILHLAREACLTSPGPSPHGDLSLLPSLVPDLMVKLLCFVFKQDLLQLQYEGVAVMKLFDRAKVNVNLLIFLLNKKFYGK